MACNCITNWNEKLKEKFGPTAMCNYAIMSDNTCRMVVTGYYYPTKRDGSKTKTPKDINLYPKYCPFCGKPYREDEVADEEQ